MRICIEKKEFFIFQKFALEQTHNCQNHIDTINRCKIKSQPNVIIKQKSTDVNNRNCELTLTMVHVHKSF